VNREHHPNLLSNATAFPGVTAEAGNGANDARVPRAPLGRGEAYAHAGRRDHAGSPERPGSESEVEGIQAENRCEENFAAVVSPTNPHACRVPWTFLLQTRRHCSPPLSMLGKVVDYNRATKRQFPVTVGLRNLSAPWSANSLAGESNSYSLNTWRWCFINQHWWFATVLSQIILLQKYQTTEPCFLNYFPVNVFCIKFCRLHIRFFFRNVFVYRLHGKEVAEVAFDDDCDFSVQEVNAESREMMRRALEEAEEEMRKKTQLIKQIRAMESIPIVRYSMRTETANTVCVLPTRGHNLGEYSNWHCVLKKLKNSAFRTNHVL